jgi:putative membrane protein
MMKLLFKIIINAIAVFVLADIMAGIEIEGTTAAVIVALLLIILNSILRPILIFFTLPLTIVTLGLFILVINAVIVLIADNLVEGFYVENFWWALLFGILLSVINMIFASSEK